MSKLRPSKPLVRALSSQKMSHLFVELFAGIGLVRMGLESGPWRCVYANDISPEKQEGYVLNFDDGHFELGDIWQLNPESIPSADLLTASFPCTDLSLAGNRGGLAGRESSAFWGVIRILTERQKTVGVIPLVMLENVTGFLTSHGGKDFHEALMALNGLGYFVDAFVLDAATFVPQSRPRLFVVAIHKSLLPSPLLALRDAGLFSQWDTVIESEFSRVARPDNLRHFICANEDIDWALIDAPALPSRRTQQLRDIVEQLADDSPDWWSVERVDKLLGQMSPRNAQKMRELSTAPVHCYGTVYRRTRNGKSAAELRSDGIAGCLRTPKGGSSRQILLDCGQGMIRARLLTPRELARLQGVPDSKRAVKDPIKAGFAYGDAVCVPAIAWIGKHILTPLIRAGKQTDRAQMSISL